MERLVGNRIVLREYREQDAVQIFEWTKNNNTTRWLGRRYRSPRSLKEIHDSVKKIISTPHDDGVFFAIADLATDEYVGGIDLTSIDWIDKNGILSIVIASESNRNKGIGTEAATLLLRHAFRNLKLHKVELGVYADNVSALRCYQKLGFKIEGTVRDHRFMDGAYCNLIQMGILENELKT